MRPSPELIHLFPSISPLAARRTSKIFGSARLGSWTNHALRGMSTVTRRVSSRAGAPPSPRALPSFQSGCSRQRESSWWRRRAGLPMLMREVWCLEVPKGRVRASSPGGRQIDHLRHPSGSESSLIRRRSSQSWSARLARNSLATSSSRSRTFPADVRLPPR
jgi:hypothetical protein